MNETTAGKRSEAPSRTRPRGSVKVFLLAFAVFCGLGGAWAVTNPLMSLPDEPAHTIHAAAVVRGEWTGVPTGEGGWTRVEVPTYIAEAHELPCFAFQSGLSAQCQMLVTDDDSPRQVTTSAGSYDPVYYSFVGLPSLVLDGKAAYYGMRGFSVALVSAFLAMSVVALVQLRRRSFALIALAVAVTPKVLFLNGGINPNSLEITAAVMLFAWMTLLAQRHREDGVPPGRVAMVAVASVALANTRSISPLWVLIIVGACLLDLHLVKTLVKSRAFWVGVVAIGLGSAFCVGWNLWTSSLSVSTLSAGSGTSFSVASRTMAFLTFENLQGYVGIFGWQEVPAPFTTVSIWGAFMLAAVLGGWFFGRGRDKRAVVVLTLAFLLVPPILQGYAAEDYGYIWQARYLLAVVCPLVVAGGVALDTAFPEAFATSKARRLGVFVIVALGIMQFHTFVWNLQRYVLGMPDGWSRMFTDPEWLPPGGWYVWASVLLVSLVAGGVLLWAAALRGGGRRAEDAAPRLDDDGSTSASGSAAAVVDAGKQVAHGPR